MDIISLAVALTAIFALIKVFMNSADIKTQGEILAGRAKAVGIVEEVAKALPDMSAVLKKVADAQVDDKITPEELQSIADEAKKVQEHASAIKSKSAS